MKLYLAEKPSLGRAIADVLPKPHRKEQGCIWLANGDCVSWCIGHLLEQAEPEQYDSRFKSWRLDDLPILPQQWQLTPKSKTKSQLNLLKRLIKNADALIHAGDPDREGQLLVDEVINFCRPKRDCAVDRLLVNDLNPAAIRKALKALRPNQEFMALSVSALARSRADWLFGINMTRAYTLKGGEQGYQGVLSVGRVQTPVLALVARRDAEIESFVSKPFYEVRAHLSTLPESSGEQFFAKWKPSQACEPYQDEEGRVLLRALAENVATRITQQPAKVVKVDLQPKKQPPPLPYNLSSLQIDAAKAFGLSARQVLDTCQVLYERHKLITYPRSDCRYLPVGHHAQAGDVTKAIAANQPDLAEAVTGCQLNLRSSAWNDAKVEAHHAIIPTQRQLSRAKLSEVESKVYRLIARQYLYQFYPAMRYEQTKVEVEIQGGRFTASAKRPIEQGWKQIAPSSKHSEPAFLPKLTVGQALFCLEGLIDDKQTTPPKHFTDATLLAAMTGIARFVQDPELKSILKETDGLGTEATRAGIIELLFKRNFLRREGKAIRATDSGKALIDALPESVTCADMTAHWESQLESMSHRKISYKAFISPMVTQLDGLIEQARVAEVPQLAGLTQPKSKKRFSKRRYSGKARKKA